MIGRFARVGQLPGDFGRFVEVVGATLLALRGSLPRTAWLIADFEASDAKRSALVALSGLASSRSRAIAEAVSSIFISGRWLGGLRFGMAVDSLGWVCSSMASPSARGNASRASRRQFPRGSSPASARVG